MEKTRLVFYKSEIWIIAVCTFCLQMPDLKVASIKLSELLMLVILPFYIKELFKSKTLLYFLAFYVLFMLKTFVVNIFTHFYINDDLPLLKEPYFISTSRLIEMLACIVFCIFVINSFKLVKDPLQLIKKLLFVQIFCLGLLYIFVYMLYATHLLHTTSYDNLIVYDTSEGEMVYRLRGFYVEGGPFGLFCAFLFTVCIAFYKKLQLNIWYLIICGVLVFLASSRAGEIMIMLTFFVFVGIKIRYVFDNIFAKVGLFLVVAIGAIYMSRIILDTYVADMGDVEERVGLFSPGELDPNFMLGRISASVIVPNMLKTQWVQGIGWGNYPLLRNNPQYRTFMPEIPVSMWDATGFGGMLDMMIEAGAILFLIYLFLYFRVARLINKHFEQPGYLILAFVGPLLLGVAIYFCYTWFLLGIVLYFSNKTITGKDNRETAGIAEKDINNI
jgi:hypothetical protein